MYYKLAPAGDGYNLKPCADQIRKIGLNKAVLEPEREQIGNTSQAGQYKDDPGSKNIPDNWVQNVNQLWNQSLTANILFVLVFGAKADENTKSPADQSAGNIGDTATNDGPAHRGGNKGRNEGAPLISAALFFSCGDGGLHC